MEESQARTYEYKPRWLAILLGTLVCGAGATVAAFLARSNHGIRLHGIRLPPEMAAGVWWSLTTLGLGGVLVFLLMAAHRLIHTQRIVLTPTAIVVPKGRVVWKAVVIPYSTILDLSVSQVYRQRFLKITHQGGEIAIASSFLPTNRDFESIHDSLVEEIGSRRIPEGAHPLFPSAYDVSERPAKRQ
jgi:hypothetical protein